MTLHIDDEAQRRFEEGIRKFTLASRIDWTSVTSVLSDDDREFLTEIYQRRMQAAGKRTMLVQALGNAATLHEFQVFNGSLYYNVVNALLDLDYEDGVSDEESDRVVSILKTIDFYRSEHIEAIAGELCRLIEAYIFGPRTGDPESWKKIEEMDVSREVARKMELLNQS